MRAESYLRPATLDEALVALEKLGADALVIAGGTDLVPAMRRTRHSDAGDDGGRPRILVDVGLLHEIAGMSEADGVIHIGGGATMAAVAANPLLKEKTPVLADAARSVGSPLIRNRATVGGNLATASPSADTAPALLALDARVRLVSVDGTREVPLSEFFVAYRSTQRRDTELITDILVPTPSPAAAGRFKKVGLRNADAISVACVAALLELEGTRCLKARVALGAVAPVPVRALTVEQALVGRDVDAAAARECARLVHEDIAPIDDVRGSGEYRGWVAEAVVARTIMETVGTGDAD